MAYNIVKKGDSVCLVKKQRRKPYESYIGSLGIMDDNEFKKVQEYIHSLPQESRIAACQKIGFRETRGIDTSKSVRIINLPKIKPKKVTDKRWKPKQHRKETKRVIPGSIARGERPEIREDGAEIRRLAGKDPIVFRRGASIGEKKAILDKRIAFIEKQISNHKEYKAQREKAYGREKLTATSRRLIDRDIEMHDSFIQAGKTALKMVEKQKSGISWVRR